MLHDGKMPPEAQAAWEKASQIAQRRQAERRVKEIREQSMCAPECLVKLLRRKGEKPYVKALAQGMKTSDKGTSLLDMANAARKHGIPLKGVKLTTDGMRKQSLPLIALIGGGHYVIVGELTAKEITIWDPNGRGIRQPSHKTVPTKGWQQAWGGRRYGRGIAPGVNGILLYAATESLSRRQWIVERAGGSTPTGSVRIG